MVESAGRSIRVLTGVYLAAILLFVLAPLLVVAGVSFTGGDYVTFPPQGFSLRWYEAVFNSSVYVSAALLNEFFGARSAKARPECPNRARWPHWLSGTDSLSLLWNRP